MKTLKQLLHENRDIKESEIPKEWMPSFNKFMFGQTCMAEANEDGSIKEFIYYAGDFRRWYFQNEKAIERDIQIDKIIDNEKEIDN
jgi:hypothetical protein